MNEKKAKKQNKYIETIKKIGKSKRGKALLFFIFYFIFFFLIISLIRTNYASNRNTSNNDTNNGQNSKQENEAPILPQADETARADEDDIMSVDIQKELEAKFDELFGAFDEDDK